MGKPSELMQLLKTGNSDAARKLITKMKKSGELVTASLLFLCTLRLCIEAATLSGGPHMAQLFITAFIALGMAGGVLTS